MDLIKIWDAGGNLCSVQLLNNNSRFFEVKSLITSSIPKCNFCLRPVASRITPVAIGMFTEASEKTNVITSETLGNANLALVGSKIIFVVSEATLETFGED